MLWRRINDYEDLVGIVKLMDFLDERRVGNYNHPFNDKKFPITPASFETFVKDLTKEDDAERKTQMVSNWVYSNCPYNSAHGNIKNQFSKAKDAFYYYKRMEENVS